MGDVLFKLLLKSYFEYSKLLFQGSWGKLTQGEIVRMKILGRCLIVLIFLASYALAGTIYYVDATSGSDSNNGRTPSSAWKSLNKVNNQLFSPGDSILFKRGEIWEGSEKLNIVWSGSPTNPINFDAYGEGDKPVISVVIPLPAWDEYESWENEGNNLWSTTYAFYPYRMFFDGNENIEARSQADLNSDECWWYDSQTGKIYIYALNNPSIAYSSIKHSRGDWRAILLSNVDYIKIYNLDIRGGGASLEIRYGSTNITVDGCFLGQYAAQGIKINGSYCEVKNCVISSGMNCMTYSYNINGLSDGIIIQGDDYNANYNLIHHNTISDWGHTGISIECQTGGNTANFNEVYENDISSSHTNYCRGIGTAGNADGRCSFNKFYRNYIHDTSVHNQLHGDHNEFYYNIIVDVFETPYIRGRGWSNGINLFGSNEFNNVCHHNIIYNNVIHEIEGFGLGLDGWYGSQDVEDNLIRNNIITNWGEGHHGIRIVDHPTVKGNTFQNNCLYKSGVTDVVYYGHDPSNHYPYTMEEFNSQNGTAGDVISSNINVDPRFVAMQYNDFALHDDSPCINMGLDLGLSRDFAGNTIPYGSGVDIGAFEFIASIPLRAEINAAPFSGWIPLTVSFSSVPSGGTDPYSFSWDFGDGNSSSAQNPTHTFTSPGNYTVTFILTDIHGGQDTDTLNINASQQVASLTATAIASPVAGEIPLAVNFNGSVSGGTPPYTYTWDFGDETSANNQNTSHTYTNPGDYTVIFTVRDSDKRQGAVTLSISASQQTPTLTASVSASPLSGLVPLEVNFYGNASGGEAPYSYSWDFGDGSSSINQNTSHTYTKVDTYTVILTVRDSSGNLASESLLINVQADTPQVQLDMSLETGLPAEESGGTTQPSPGIHTYSAGSIVQISASPFADYRFSKWKGDIDEQNTFSRETSLLMDYNKVITAYLCTQCGDVNGDLNVTPSDAQAAFDIFLGILSNPTECQLENADVNADGIPTAPNVTPADAQAIFEYFLGIRALPGDCSSSSRSSAAGVIAQLEKKSAADRDFPAPRLIINDIDVIPGEIISVPVIINNPSGISSFGFDLLFDGDILEFIGVEKSDILQDFQELNGNPIAKGLVRVGGFTFKLIEDSSPSELVRLVFKVKAESLQRAFFMLIQLYDDLAQSHDH